MACRRSGKQSAAQHLPANAHTRCRPHRHAQTALLEQRINDGLALAVRLKALLVFSGGVPAGSTINEAEAMLRYAQRCHARQLHRCDNVLSSNLHRHRLEKTPSSC